jgi:hypothetical protein
MGILRGKKDLDTDSEKNISGWFIFWNPNILCRKRSEYFCSFEQFLLDTNGASDREITACRQNADIIVAGSPHIGPTAGKARIFQDLQEALGKDSS